MEHAWDRDGDHRREVATNVPARTKEDEVNTSHVEVWRTCAPSVARFGFGGVRRCEIWMRGEWWVFHFGNSKETGAGAGGNRNHWPYLVRTSWEGGRAVDSMIWPSPT